MEWGFCIQGTLSLASWGRSEYTWQQKEFTAFLCMVPVLRREWSVLAGVVCDYLDGGIGLGRRPLV